MKPWLRLLYLLLFFSLTFGVGSVFAQAPDSSGNQLAGQPGLHTGSEVEVHAVQAEVLSYAAPNEIAKVAIFQDRAPWGQSTNEQILRDNEISFDIFGSARMGDEDLDLSEYDKVIISSVQTVGFYDALNEQREWFEAYAEAGGVLQIHSCSYTWIGGNVWDRILPGGFVRSPLLSQTVAIDEEGHPFVASPNDVPLAALQNWNWSTHGYFSTVPEGALSVISVSERPAAMELPYGAGLIIATVQTVEWSRSSRDYQENLILHQAVQQEKFQIEVAAEPEEGGEVTGGGEYLPGVSATVNATANEGWAFKNWTEGEDADVVSESAQYTFDVDADRTLVANFTDETYTIGVTAVPEEGGSVEGGGEFLHGTEVQVKALANEGFAFVNWVEGEEEVSNRPVYTFTATADRELEAVFEELDEVGVIRGMVTDAVTGDPLPGVEVTVAGITATTDDDGNYEIENVPPALVEANFYADVTAGEMDLEVNFTDTSTDAAHNLFGVKEGYVDYVNNRVLVPAFGDVTYSFSMSPEVVEGGMRVVLNWGANPRDLDLHLQTPEIDGRQHHVYFANRGSEDSAPYARLDQDVTRGYGPETITIHERYAGLYHVYVHLFAGDGTLPTSEAIVQVYNEFGLVETLNVPEAPAVDPEDDQILRYWYIGTIEGDTGHFTVINEIQRRAPGVGVADAGVAFGEPAETKQELLVLETWAWDFGDGNTSEEQNPTHTYVSPGVYTVSLTVTNDEGLSDTMVREEYITVEGVVPTISAIGRVLTVGVGFGVSNVEIDGLPGTPVTDYNGRFEFEVPAEHGWETVLTPVREGWRFLPPTRAIAVIERQDGSGFQLSRAPTFEAEVIPIEISGFVRNQDGAGVEGVSMLGLPGRPTTDENGFYSTEVPWGWSGTIRPRMEGMYFDPNLRPYRNLTEDQLNQNFTALGGYVISGQVTDSQGFPAIGVRMLGLPEEPVTGNDGTYYDVVPPGWTGAVQPVKSGWMFEPEFRTYQGMSADMLEQDYLGGQIFFEWGSEIGLVNFSEEQRLSGDLIGFDFMGNETWRMPVDLAPEGRLELDLRVMPEAEAIQYIFFRGSGDSLGYQKFFKPEEYRVGLEAALDTTQAEELYIPHVDSSDDRDWWTGVAVVNTTDDPKTLTIHFKDADGEQAAESREIDLAPGEHNAFLIRSLFGNQHQPNIRSAQIENSEGLVGLELFGGLVTNRLSGVRLSEEKSTELVYPHIVEDEEWWTGINAYNPQYHDVDDVTAMMSVTYYNMGGTQVGLIEDAFVNSRTSKVNTGAGLPAGTAWQRVIADRPMLGFQLFGKYTGEQLAGYNVVNLASRVGVFPKIEKDGWTGIAFVNLEPETANIKLQALDNLGYVVAESDISMAPYSKKVELIEDVFDLDVDLATYVRYNSDRDVAGFQLNGTNDQTMLDAIPALSQAGSNLYYPHIHVGGERMRELIYRIIAE